MMRSRSTAGWIRNAMEIRRRSGILMAVYVPGTSFDVDFASLTFCFTEATSNLGVADD